MIVELKSDDIRQFPELCVDQQMRMVIESVAEGNTLARIWQVAGSTNRTVFLWDQGNNVFYISNKKNSDVDLVSLEELIQTEIRDQAISENSCHFKMRFLTTEDTELSKRLLKDFYKGHLLERFYTYVKNSVDPDSFPYPSDIQFERIDRKLLENTALTGNRELLDEIRWMWPSVERFNEKGFGIAALSGDTIVCRCTAEYVSRRICGIGIETVESREKQGIAAAVTARFVDYCLKRSIIPCWECNSDNVASVRVAEKTGFVLSTETCFDIGRFA